MRNLNEAIVDAQEAVEDFEANMTHVTTVPQLPEAYKLTARKDLPPPFNLLDGQRAEHLKRIGEWKRELAVWKGLFEKWQKEIDEAAGQAAAGPSGQNAGDDEEAKDKNRQAEVEAKARPVKLEEADVIEEAQPEVKEPHLVAKARGAREQLGAVEEPGVRPEVRVAARVAAKVVEVDVEVKVEEREPEVGKIKATETMEMIQATM